jgi:hypothetical protein
VDWESRIYASTDVCGLSTAAAALEFFMAGAAAGSDGKIGMKETDAKILNIMTICIEIV